MTATVQDFDSPALDSDEPVIAPDEHDVVFYARGQNIKLVRRGTLYRYSAGGQRQVAQKPIIVEFGPLARIVVRPGDVVGVDSDGWLADDAVLGERGLPTGLLKRDMVTALRSHHALNDLFFEEGREPGRPLPTEADFLESITAAVADLDTEKLQELLEQEQGSHNRGLLVTTAERALERVRQAVAAVEQKAAGAS